MQSAEQVSSPDLQEDRPPLVARAFLAAERALRPHLGWGVLFTCMWLSLLPAAALHENRWLALGSLQRGVDLAGPLAVATVWLLWGWRAPRSSRLPLWVVVAGFVTGCVVVSQSLMGWLPGPRAWWLAAATREWAELWLRVVREWADTATRVALWWQGVQMGGAGQDNLVFAGIAASVLWCLGLTVAWAARRTQQGYVAGLPSLWLLGLVLLYSTGGRWLLLAGLMLTVTLQLLLDRGTLQRRWGSLKLDYSPAVFTDQVLAVGGAVALIVTVAAVMPNLYIGPLVKRYYQWAAPANQGIEALAERMFPDLHGTSRWRGSGGGGLPNEFLLQGGPDLGSAVVLRVRTDESAGYEYPYDLGAAPPGRYMRSGTFAAYDGRGWSNPRTEERRDMRANVPWRSEVGWGRKRLVQTVVTEATSPVLYTVAEPMEVSVDATVAARGADALIAVYARDRSYSAVSSVPAVSEAMLRELPSWEGEVGLPAEMAVHLELPDTITERTRELAARILADQPTPYDRALAIESYLRQYEYDLNVPELPRNVEDVADYFLFNVQRGYCDYYATAFVVLARLGGLPARFATGFAVGAWNPGEAMWVVTEAEAHSWPEVYFPEVGWIPFEPTAGRPALARIAAPNATSPALPAPMVAAAPEAPTVASPLNWQMLVWLVPAALLVWAVVRGVAWWRMRRENPWAALVKWGRRVGHPLGAGETVLEYGEGLATYIVTRQQHQADMGRVAAREVSAVSQAVSQLAYGPEHRRAAERAKLDAHWRRLRGYLGLLKLR